MSDQIRYVSPEQIPSGRRRATSETRETILGQLALPLALRLGREREMQRSRTFTTVNDAQESPLRRSRLDLVE